MTSAQDGLHMYRQARAAPETLRPAAQEFPATLQESWIGDFAYVSNSGTVMLPRFTTAAVALTVLSLAPTVGAVIAILADEMDALRVMLVFVAICVPLSAYVWIASRRLVKVGAAINRGDWEGAESKLKGKSLALYGLAVGLLAQLRGQHEQAVAGYEAVVRILEMPRSMPTPVTQQAYPRAAIALTNLGRYEAAAPLVARAAQSGEYVATLQAVAAAYLMMASGQQLFPGGAPSASAMAEHFRKIRGSWGGLALAAYGYQQLGDRESCDKLLREERTRPNYERVAAFLPTLFAWISQQESASS